MDKLRNKFISFAGAATLATVPHISFASDVSPPNTCLITDSGKISVINKDGGAMFSDQLRRPGPIEKLFDWSAQLVGDTGPVTISARPGMKGDVTVCHFKDLNGKNYILDVQPVHHGIPTNPYQLVSALKL